MYQTVDEILKNKHLSVTESRRKILGLFHQTSSALAHGDIERLSGEQFDRVTVYRTLQTFVDKGIIHTIPTADNAVLYALCKDDCSGGHHQDNHVHFICDHCNTTFCLDHVVIPEIILPGGFQAHQTNVVISGICNHC
jgi:Fur family ferric uptake transcriptional regulator